MAVYQDKALERVSKGIRKYKSVAQKARANNAQESDTRMIVSSFLSDGIGWDAFDNLTGEYRIKGSFADFVLRKDGKHFMIIEVKSVSSKLNEKHLDQAVAYAAREGVEWVLLTNGAEWRLYRVLFTKPVDCELVFEVSLTDEEMKPRQKAELLYLLTPEAQKKDELEMFYQRQRAISGPNIARLLLTESVLSKLRSEIKAESGYKLDLVELSQVIVSCVLRPEVRGDAVDKQLKRVKNAAKAAPRKRPACPADDATRTTSTDAADKPAI